MGLDEIMHGCECREKSRGPRIDPWSIPTLRGQGEEEEPAKETEKAQSVQEREDPSVWLGSQAKKRE